MSKKIRFSVVVLLALILSVVAYAFAATNTVADSSAGDGLKAISGYAITNVHYTLTSGNPTTIDTVTFTIAPATAAHVYVKLVQSGSAYTECTNTAGSVTCNIGGAVTTLAADELRVIAAQ